MMRKLLLIFVILIYGGVLAAQELNCQVQVSAQQIQGTNKQVFETLQSDIFEFMTTRKWTNHVYSLDERIECNILINITEQVSSDEFKGTIQIQARRPVYNSSYNSVTLNFLDNDLHFKYIEYQPLEFNESTHTSNLTSLLAYYSYIILGLDYDSFTTEGGNEFFKKAEKIVNNAQNASEKGWKSFESKKNRYWLVENLLNERYNPIREFFYRYHRLGLDVMYEKVNDGRAEILATLELLQKVYRDKPGLFALRIVFDAKADELVNVFSDGFPEEKNKAYNILKEIDPSNSSKYAKIRN